MNGLLALILLFVAMRLYGDLLVMLACRLVVFLAAVYLSAHLAFLLVRLLHDFGLAATVTRLATFGLMFGLTWMLLARMAQRVQQGNLTETQIVALDVGRVAAWFSLIVVSGWLLWSWFQTSDRSPSLGCCIGIALFLACIDVVAAPTVGRFANAFEKSVGLKLK